MKKNIDETSVCGRDLNACLPLIEQFHGWKAPGLVVGMFMVDLAVAPIGEGIEFDAVVESRYCLPDAIQLFTPCTVGNGWLKVVDWDKFAVTFYNRCSLTGCRVWLDLQKTKRHPLYYG
jgi:formylmethanofuran dehydrogenase subunit E